MKDSRDFREEFRPTADEYRRVSRFLMIPVFLALGLGALVYFLKRTSYAIAGLAICILLPVVGSLIWLPKLICPGCHERVDKDAGFMGQSGMGKYCPECGKAAIEMGWFYPKCTACGKSLSRGRGGRQYKIRYCPWCDAHIDEKGV